MHVKIEPSWKIHLESEFQKPYFKQLIDFVKQEYAHHTIYPPARQIFHAFELCKFDATKVVILGQDPYHGPGQANGLCFSVNDGVRIPPSLINIFKEIQAELGKLIPSSGNLERWAQQGVLLLNATLTVRAGKPGSHQKQGWETFTDAVIRIVAQQKTQVVFLLWGAYAQQKASLIDTQNNLVLQSAHPSPYSADRGFFGNNHFIKTNGYLGTHGLKPIDW
jgi:uracil-DNA glycosylase